ncbi:GPCR fungal pheromone mating factor [Dipodascopsis tothii]|uniref:GPCR fungal pheromone mating factor n=1 Tax=Dipodascopsis tothii TaxID=44089 RepID=UPI0034CD9DFC
MQVYKPLFGLCLTAVIITIAPLFWHIRHRNFPAIFLIFWTLIQCSFQLACSIIWGGEDVETMWDGHIFCDIDVKLLIGTGVGILGSVAAMARHLAMIMCKSSLVYNTKAGRRKQLIYDILFAFGTPIWIMSFHYLSQTNRYDIMQYSGCLATVDNNYLSLFMLFIWTPIWGLVGCYYAGMTVYRYFLIRREFREVLQSSQSGLTVARFARLLIFCYLVIGVSFPLSIYVFYLNCVAGFHAYSFEAVHSMMDFQTVRRYPAESPLFDSWQGFVIAFLLFFFFGIGSDAIDMYRTWLVSLGFKRVFPKWKWLNQKPQSTGLTGLYGTGDESLETKFGTMQASILQKSRAE